LYQLLRPVLFLLPAEKAHYITLWLFKNALKWPLLRFFMPTYSSNKICNNEPIELMGILFKNKVGLAAGFDKMQPTLTKWRNWVLVLLKLVR